MNAIFFLSLGSNEGHRLHNLQKAHTLISQFSKVLQSSIILETEALLPPNAPSHWNSPFLNQVIAIETDLSPIDLLKKLKSIEQQLGRPQIYKRWSPRTLDMDILYTEAYPTYQHPELQLPHPELTNRPFLLHLLALIAPYQKIALPNTPYDGLSFHTIGQRFLTLSGLFKQAWVSHPKLVGIVNITPDSHSDQGKYFETDHAIAHALKLHAAGASMIDLGAQSTRVGATRLSVDEEWKRLEPVLHELNHIHPSLHLSIDTFYDEIALKALQYPVVKCLNNVQGLFQSDTLKTIANNGCQYIAMHSFTVPPNPNHTFDTQTNPICSLLEWGKKTTNSLLEHGFTQEAIIIDPGIGFGNSIYQSLQILEALKTLKEAGMTLLIGHAHKNFMTTFTQKPRPERAIETLAISAAIHEQCVDYLRIYDVDMHQSFFSAQAALRP